MLSLVLLPLTCPIVTDCRASLRGHPVQGLCTAHLHRGEQACEAQAHLVLADGLGRERCQEGAGELTLAVLAVHGQLHSLQGMAAQLVGAACKTSAVHFDAYQAAMSAGMERLCWTGAGCKYKLAYAR